MRRLLSWQMAHALGGALLALGALLAYAGKRRIANCSARGARPPAAALPKAR